MSECQMFCLKSNSFKDNIVKSLGYLRQENNLFDVTLFSDDHNHVSAHKLVLSASSEYFRDIFRKSNMPQSEMLLCLEGLNSQELNNVLEYMYNGEIKIFQDDLKRFMEIAERLKLEGLTGANEVNEENFQKPELDNQKFSTALKNEDLMVPSEAFERNSYSTARKISDYGDSYRRISTNVSSSLELISDTFSSIEELNQRVDEEIAKDNDGMWRCSRCPKVSKNKGHIKEHVEVHLDDISFPCQFCDKTFRSRASIRFHRKQCM